LPANWLLALPCAAGLKVGMMTQKYQQELEATAACTLHLAEGYIASGDDHCHTIHGDAWFGSVKSAAAL